MTNSFLLFHKYEEPEVWSARPISIHGRWLRPLLHIYARRLIAEEAVSPVAVPMSAGISSQVVLVCQYFSVVVRTTTSTVLSAFLGRLVHR